MVARRGSQRVWHFAHKPPTDGCADPDRALHEVAKGLIVQGFAAALEGGGEYRAGFACEDCDKEVAANVALQGRSVATERTVVEGTRSDVVIERGEKPPLIVEVVVSHDLDPATSGRYQRAGVPVFVVNVAWATVGDLARAVHANEVLNVPSKRCLSCQRDAERRQQETAKAQTWAETALGGLRASEDGGEVTDAGFLPWKRDRFGRELYPRVRQRIRENAAILQRIGFTQQTHKPWLFRYRLPDGSGDVYADFGSSEVIPIWEDSAALLYCFLKGDLDARKAALMPLVIERCEAAGAAVRVSFHERYLD